MSERIRITHKEMIAGGPDITLRVEIHDEEHEGPASEKLAADSDFFSLEYDTLDERNIFDRPVQGSVFGVDLFVEGPDELELLTDMVGAAPGRFELRYYIDDDHQWSGMIDTGLLDYPERAYPFTARIGANDLKRLEGNEFPLVASSQTGVLIGIIAECLLKTGLTFPIHTLTNWTNLNFNQSDDFLNQVHHQRFHFRQYRGGGDEQDQPITYSEVLDHICRTYALIIRQVPGPAGPVWMVTQPTALAKGDAWLFVYNENGVQQSVDQNPDITTAIDQQTAFLHETSRNRITPAVQKVVSTYNHKTLVSSFLFAAEYVHDSVVDQSNVSVDLESDGSYRVNVAGRVEVDIEDPLSAPQSGNAELVITSDDPGSFHEVHPILVSATSGTRLSGPINFQSESNIPVGIEQVTISLRWATVSGHTVERVRWFDLAATLMSGDTVADSAALKFVLRRPQP